MPSEKRSSSMFDGNVDSTKWKRNSASKRTETASSSSAEKATVKKGFSMLSLLGLAFAILNSWVAMSTSLSIALPSGGPTVILYGVLVAGIGSLSIAASLAEMCAVWPTGEFFPPSGQYYWTAVLASPRYSRSLSWICGWFSVSGWIFLVATGGSLGGTLVTSIISLLHEDYVPERWHIFLIYTAYTLLALFLNLFMSRLLPRIDKAAFYWSIGGVIVISVVLLATASPKFSSPQFVFTDFINTTNWPNGIAWILGLLQPAFGLTAFDACAHIVEEIDNPAYYAPRVMVYAVLIGTGSSFVFLLILLFCLNDLESVLTSAAGPLLEIFFQATGSKAGAVCLLVIPVVCMAFTTQALLTTASRMTMAFARDNGMPFSKYLSKIDKHRDVPTAALLFCTAWVILFGCVFLGSSTALNAIISSSVISLNISYAFPIAILTVRGRSQLGKGSFFLGNILGPACNIIGLVFVLITTVFFVFPPLLPVTASNMNYSVIVLGIVGIISALTWSLEGSKSYRGPSASHL